MLQNVTEKPLTPKQVRAAALLAADELSDEQIAESLDVSRMTLSRWKGIPAFDDAVLRAIEKMDRAALRFAAARRDKRLQILDDLLNKSLAVIDARSKAHADDEDILGGETGLVVTDKKGVGAGTAAIVIDMQGVDTALMAEIRGLLDDAAKEVGGRAQSLNLSGELTSTVELVGIAAEDI